MDGETDGVRKGTQGLVFRRLTFPVEKLKEMEEARQCRAPQNEAKMEGGKFAKELRDLGKEKYLDVHVRVKGDMRR